MFNVYFYFVLFRNAKAVRGIINYTHQNMYARVETDRNNNNNNNIGIH